MSGTAKPSLEKRLEWLQDTMAIEAEAEMLAGETLERVAMWRAYATTSEDALARLRRDREALRKVREEMNKVRSGEWARETTRDGKVERLAGVAWPHQLDSWLAALDAILEEKP